MGLARERRQWLGDGSATDTLQVRHQVLRLANFRVQVVALAARGFSQTS